MNINQSCLVLLISAAVLNGTPLKNGELIEIDDGLASHFFYCYSQSTVLPAKVFGLEHEGGAHHA